MKYKFFDCDGNIIDSEAIAMPIARDTLVNLAEEQGVQIPKQIVDGMFGKTIQNMVDFLREDFNVSFPDDIRSIIHQETLLALTHKTKPVDGIGEYLEILSMKGYVPVVVTSSEFDRVRAGITCAGLRGFFPDKYIFSAIDSLPVPTPKPSPEIYNFALSSLGILPYEVDTSEDSKSGVTSSITAGIDCYGNVSGSHVKHIADEHAAALLKAGAKYVFRNWKEMISLIEPNRKTNRTKPRPFVL